MRVMKTATLRQRVWLALLSGLSGLGLVVAMLWFTPTPYYITAPGAAIDTSRLIAVKGGEIRRGHLYMLVLNAQPANLFWYLDAKLDGRNLLENKQEFLGAIPDYEKYQELSRQMMADSRNTAPALALKHLGYGKGVTPVGVQVTDLRSDSPAKGILEKGDIIVGVSGTVVRRTVDLPALLQPFRPGNPVPVRVKRGGGEMELTVPTFPHPDDPTRAAFGIFIKDALEFDLPIPVAIASGEISGPSAGLMFTLQIIDQMTPGGITGGRVIAGTGTIEADGSVGPIGGVQQKVFTAEAAGAEVMFVPQGNYEDAKKVATRIQLVPVGTLDQALAWLEQNATNTDR